MRGKLPFIYSILKLRLTKTKQTMKYIEKHNEATIQYELYFQLRNKGFTVVPEYQVIDEFNKTKKGSTRRAKFDLIVVVGETIICAIETKKENKRKILPDEPKKTVQKDRYEKILGDIPLFYCRRMDSIPSLVEKIQALIELKIKMETAEIYQVCDEDGVYQMTLSVSTDELADFDINAWIKFYHPTWFYQEILVSQRTDDTQISGKNKL